MEHIELKSQCINTKVDMEEMICCKDCILRYTNRCVLYDQAFPVYKSDYWFAPMEKEKIMNNKSFKAVSNAFLLKYHS